MQGGVHATPWLDWCAEGKAYCIEETEVPKHLGQPREYDMFPARKYRGMDPRDRLLALLCCFKWLAMNDST
ncbi:unnamed protein product [Heligmosomoides polygyrus]|uniref:Uncharacterized protein n=1 Tax=Heligmosomoides polygyrus TaxID=6339 RepID=A0A3P7XQV1_HELPZ|nr:unnamed protein product [Heligmosomoides polygyrus]